MHLIIIMLKNYVLSHMCANDCMAVSVHCCNAVFNSLNCFSLCIESFTSVRVHTVLHVHTYVCIAMLNFESTLNSCEIR